MSRSYKRTPHSRGAWKDQSVKQYAKRKVRRKLMDEDLPQHSWYKRLFHPYDIYERDTLPVSFEQYYANELTAWYKWGHALGRPFPSRDEKRKEFNKRFRRK